MESNIIKTDELKLMYIQATSFPEGVSDAWNQLESRLPSLQGRKFYGASEIREGEIEYRACVAYSDKQEPERCNLETFIIPAGSYATRKLLNWSEQLNMVGVIFDELAATNQIDPKRPPFLEYYKSQKELILMVPVSE